MALCVFLSCFSVHIFPNLQSAKIADDKISHTVISEARGQRTSSGSMRFAKSTFFFSILLLSVSDGQFLMHVGK